MGGWSQRPPEELLQVKEPAAGTGAATLNVTYMGNGWTPARAFSNAVCQLQLGMGGVWKRGCSKTTYSFRKVSLAMLEVRGDRKA